VIGDHFVIGESIYLETNKFFPKKLLRELRGRGIEKISFKGGLTYGELKQFILFLASGKETSPNRKWENISYGILATFDGSSSSSGPLTHSLNVCSMVLAQAMRIGIQESGIREIGLSALLHDVGKIQIPREVLHKPGKLDATEFAQVAGHSVAGANILRKIDCGSELPMIVCFEHHIKYNFGGYPKVTYRIPLNIASCMTQIADVYDALRTNRPYRKSLSLESSITIMREGRGTEFEPVLFDNFMEIIALAESEKSESDDEPSGIVSPPALTV